MRVGTWAKRAVLLTGFAAALGAVSPANAVSIGPINLGDYSGPVTIKYTGATTGFNTHALSNETTWGAAFVTSVFETGNSGNNFYAQTALAPKIGVFIYGIADASIIPDGGGFNIYNVGCTGGSCDGKIHVDFYQLAAAATTNFGGALDITDRTGFSTFTGITGGISLMKWELTPGKVLVDDGSTLFNETLATMFQNANAVTLPTTGDGQFFAECVSGPGCLVLENNAYPNGADFDGGFDLSAITTGNQFINGWRGAIDDPVDTILMPEPATLSLFGVSLLGLGFSAKRRKKAKG